MTCNEAHDFQKAAALVKAKALIAALEALADNVHWGHVGSLEKVNADLLEVCRFYRA